MGQQLLVPFGGESGSESESDGRELKKKGNFLTIDIACVHEKAVFVKKLHSECEGAFYKVNCQMGGIMLNFEPRCVSPTESFFI